MQRLLIVGSLALLLSGCAVGSGWSKPDGTQQIFDAESTKCEAQASVVKDAPVLQRQDRYNACMKGLGWQQEQRPAPVPATAAN